LKSNAPLAFHAGLLNRFHLHEGQREILRLLPVAYRRRCGPYDTTQAEDSFDRLTTDAKI
jgi:hypothetical protein